MLGLGMRKIAVVASGSSEVGGKVLLQAGEEKAILTVTMLTAARAALRSLV